MRRKKYIWKESIKTYKSNVQCNIKIYNFFLSLCGEEREISWQQSTTKQEIVKYCCAIKSIFGSLRFFQTSGKSTFWMSVSINRINIFFTFFMISMLNFGRSSLRSTLYLFISSQLIVLQNKNKKIYTTMKTFFTQESMIPSPNVCIWVIKIIFTLFFRCLGGWTSHKKNLFRCKYVFTLGPTDGVWGSNFPVKYF